MSIATDIKSKGHDAVLNQLTQESIECVSVRINRLQLAELIAHSGALISIDKLLKSTVEKVDDKETLKTISTILSKVFPEEINDGSVTSIDGNSESKAD